MLKSFLTWKWILATVLVIAAVAVMIRLGFWQLDRLAERKATNAAVTSQINAPELNLNLVSSYDQLRDMEYRSVAVTGVYDFTQEVVLRSQVYNGNLGYDVLTPLIIQGVSSMVLVNRGWIPYDSAQPDQRAQYDEPGVVTVKGRLRLPLSQSSIFGDPDPTLAAGQARLDAWNAINLDRLQKQVNAPLLPVYIQEAPDPAWTSLPYRNITLPDLTDGPHLSYAIQWFSFSTVLAVGYPFLVRRRLKKGRTKDSLNP